MQPEPIKLNPFLKIWIYPKKTIRQIVETDPDLYVLPLAIISGIYRGLDNAINNALGDSMSLFAILLFSIIAGGFGGVIGLAISTSLFTWAGKLLGGSGDRKHVRSAIAWSSLPDAILLMIVTIPIAVFGKEYFSTSTPWIDSHLILLSIIVIPLVILSIVLSIWRVYILANCLGEVHSFSAWKGLATAVIGILVIAIPIIIFVVLISSV